MVDIGLFYGSTNGNTAHVARQIQQTFARAGIDTVELLDIADYYLADTLDFDLLIFGVPTWNVGQLQTDWEAVMDEFDELDLTGKRVALFGLGDQIGYPDTFVDALAFVADRAQTCGAQLVGKWPVSGYDFVNSWAFGDGHFVGLVVDEDNQPSLTAARVETWVAQLIYEFGLVGKARSEGPRGRPGVRSDERRNEA